ncbi:MAG: hypothetical protein ACRCY3_09100 [Sphingorhabdus sp.]
MKRSFSNRMFDFMGRAAFGGENGFVRDKRLAATAMVLGVLMVLSGSWLFAVGFVGLIMAVFVSDVRKYNREHGNG